jgi:hypothetical protein
MKYIEVTCCRNCPYIEHNDGGGFIEPFVKCRKFNFVMIDENKSFNLDKIHPKCELPIMAENSK